VYTPNAAVLQHGTLSGSGQNYVYTFTESDRTTEVNDSFTFTVSDGSSVSAPATISITIKQKEPSIVDQIIEVVNKVRRRSGGGGGRTQTPVVTPVVTVPVTPITTPVTPVANSTSRTLTVGSQGEDVRALQKYLNTNGFIIATTGTGSPGKESTVFGPATKAAVMKFQISKGISPVGYVGAVTRKAMGLATTPVYVAPANPTVPTAPVSTTGVSFTRDLKVGSSGADVKKLQQILNTKGFIIATTGTGSPGKEGTYFGPKTAEALKKFQTSKGIKPVGYVGAVTRKVLNTI
jgi:peptidoglycan hydrolase-like protein with peptidoglycan-binding domain